jgi:hypothetical protein
MEPKMIVYALSHPVTGEVRYIGKSERGLRRPKEHGKCYHYKRLSHTPLYRWIQKLKNQGLDYAIEVVEECLDRPSLMTAERYWISQFRAWGFRLLNICDGGEGFTGHHTNETKAKIAAASALRKHTPESRQKLSDTKRGLPLSEDHRQALRKPHPGAQGKKKSPETRERMRQAALLREQRRRQSST